MLRAATARIDVHLAAQDLTHSLRSDARRGLTASPKQLPPKWFYDDRGSQLFDEITRLPEYYLTRSEREILDQRASAIAHATKADTLVELGSGTSEKTRLLLGALSSHGCLRRFIPFDVSEGVLREAAGRINYDFPDLEVHGVVGDFDRHLHVIPDGGRRLIVFLGSTIGNFPPASRARFLSALAGVMHGGDALLVGFDLVKDPAVLEAAYNDSRGVTAEFNRNVLRVLNRELDADFDAERFDHVARFDPDNEWIEMLVRSTCIQSVRVAALDLTVQFASGEAMRTEISSKFRPEAVRDELTGAGLSLSHWWTDRRARFGLGLAVKT